MEIRVLAPDAWQPALDRTLDGLPPRMVATTRAIVGFLHDRHAGITPALAARLSRLLDPAPGADGLRATVGDPWRLLLDRLGDGRPAGGGAAPPRQQPVLVPSAHPYAVLSRLALPLVAEAQRRIGACVLFGGAGHARGPDAERRLTEQDQRLHAALLDLCSPDGPLPRLFWIEAALTAAAMSRQLRRGRPEQAAGLPSVDTMTLSLLTSLEPRFAARPPSRVPPQRTADRRERSGVRPHQGGVTGIRMTRSLDDIGEMTHSEHLNDSLVLLDRLANTGFLIRHRPPHRQDRRDVLVVGALPAGVTGPAARLAKACWVDAMARVAVTLRQAGRHRSDFLWLEGDRLGGFNGCRTTLEGAPPLPGNDAWTLGPEDRLAFVDRLGWLPALLDGRRRYPPELDTGDTREGLCRWTAAALPLGLRLAAGGTGLPGPETTSAYAGVHAALVLPGPKAGPQPGEAHDALLLAMNALDLRGGARSVSVLWVPDRPQALDGWCLSTRRQPLKPLAGELVPVPRPDGSDGTPDAHDLAGALVSQWLSVLEETIFGG